MTRRRRITIEERGRSVIVRGWRSGDLLEEAGIKAVFSGAVGGWMVAAKRLPDLLAHLDRRNIGVDLLPEGGDAA
jgi:hypothetical protein